MRPCAAHNMQPCNRSIINNLRLFTAQRPLARVHTRTHAVPYGPAPPPKQSQDKEEDDIPAWLQDYIDDAPYDDDVAELLEGTNNDPEAVRRKMMESMQAKHSQIYGTKLGSDAMMQVRFREIEPTNLWLWFEMQQTPSDKEREMLQEVLQSWFMMGRLGGFNALNMQVFHGAESDVSYLEYDHDECDETLEAYMHDMSEVERRGVWCRAWVDMGTADEMALDILINALMGFSKEHLGIKRMLVGGTNSDWPVPDMGGDSDVLQDGRDPLRAAMEMVRSRGGRGGGGGGQSELFGRGRRGDDDDDDDF